MLFWWGIVYRNLEGKVTTVVLPDVVLMTLEQVGRWCCMEHHACAGCGHARLPVERGAS